MQGQTGRSLAPPRALRPAQLGIILVGRVLLSHIGATLVDLASRGFVSLETAGGDDQAWRLTVVDGMPEEPLGYERVLLHGLFGRQPAIGLEHLSVWAVPVLEKTRHEIVRDAIDRGWLRPGPGRLFAMTRGQRRRRDQNPGKRTQSGKELLKEIKAFKRELRVLAGGGDTPALTRLAPYAMIFGLAAPVPTAGTAPEAPHDIAGPPARTTAFAASWLSACGAARSSDSEHWIWDPFWTNDPGYASLRGHGHAGHAGYDGGHGGFGGGHGGHGGGVGGGHV